MPGQNFFLITSLPSLGELGSAPPLRPAQLLDHVAQNRTAYQIIEYLFLSYDLLQRQGVLAGEITEPDLKILTEAQARNEEPLPDYLTIQAEDEQEETRRKKIPDDDIWEAYFRHGMVLARQCHSLFLKEVLGFEVALRNALAEARARSLELDPADYLVAPELGQAEAEVDFEEIVDDWASAATPLEGRQELDSARWEWLAANDRWFSFQNDELAAYAIRLMLLYRWDRLTHTS